MDMKSKLIDVILFSDLNAQYMERIQIVKITISIRINMIPLATGKI